MLIFLLSLVSVGNPTYTSINSYPLLFWKYDKSLSGISFKGRMLNAIHKKVQTLFFFFQMQIKMEGEVILEELLSELVSTLYLR